MPPPPIHRSIVHRPPGHRWVGSSPTRGTGSSPIQSPTRSNRHPKPSKSPPGQRLGSSVTHRSGRHTIAIDRPGHPSHPSVHRSSYGRSHPIHRPSPTRVTHHGSGGGPGRSGTCRRGSDGGRSNCHLSIHMATVDVVAGWGDGMGRGSDTCRHNRSHHRGMGRDAVGRSPTDPSPGSGDRTNRVRVDRIGIGIDPSDVGVGSDGIG